MGFSNIGVKTTFQSRPDVPTNKKILASEFNSLVSDLNANYQEFLDFKSSVESNLPVVTFNSDYAITDRGIYIFYGSTPRSITINDAISGEVQLRTVATADLTLPNKIDGYGTVFSEGERMLSLRWDPVNLTYTY